MPLAKVGREFEGKLGIIDINNRGPQGRSVESATAELRIRKIEGTQPTQSTQRYASHDATKTPILLTSIGIILYVTSSWHD